MVSEAIRANVLGAWGNRWEVRCPRVMRRTPRSVKTPAPSRCEMLEIGSVKPGMLSRDAIASVGEQDARSIGCAAMRSGATYTPAIAGSS